MQDHNQTARGLLYGLAASICLLASAQAATTEKELGPDMIQLNTGETLRGLIVRQTPMTVTIQLPYGEKTVNEKDIVRIRNTGGGEPWFAKVLAPGCLPPWRIIANDLRYTDEIKSFNKIPATFIDNGIFKNVPYESFRANQFYELNIYGDPDDPAGIEIGIHGPLRLSKPKRELLRNFMASYLTTIPEIKALYALSLNKDGQETVGPITIEITQPGDLDAYGAWWLSFYNIKKLNGIRLTDEQYRKLTVPTEEVVGKNGLVKMVESQMQKVLNTLRNPDDRTSDRSFISGFYRDKQGNFHVSETGKSAPDS